MRAEPFIVLNPKNIISFTNESKLNETLFDQNQKSYWPTDLKLFKH